jgi:hypothetical protein
VRRRAQVRIDPGRAGPPLPPDGAQRARGAVPDDCRGEIRREIVGNDLLACAATGGAFSPAASTCARRRPPGRREADLLGPQGLQSVHAHQEGQIGVARHELAS